MSTRRDVRTSSSPGGLGGVAWKNALSMASAIGRLVRDKRVGNAPETASDLCAAIEALSTSGCAYESGGHRHIDWLVTYYYDASEVATHIRTRLKVPARG